MAKFGVVVEGVSSPHSHHSEWTSDTFVDIALHTPRGNAGQRFGEVGARAAPELLEARSALIAGEHLLTLGGVEVGGDHADEYDSSSSGSRSTGGSRREPSAQGVVSAHAVRAAVTALRRSARRVSATTEDCLQRYEALGLRLLDGLADVRHGSEAGVRLNSMGMRARADAPTQFVRALAAECAQVSGELRGRLSLLGRVQRSRAHLLRLERRLREGHLLQAAHRSECGGEDASGAGRYSHGDAAVLSHSANNADHHAASYAGNPHTDSANPHTSGSRDHGATTPPAVDLSHEDADLLQELLANDVDARHTTVEGDEGSDTLHGVHGDTAQSVAHGQHTLDDLRTASSAAFSRVDRALERARLLVDDEDEYDEAVEGQHCSTGRGKDHRLRGNDAEAERVDPSVRREVRALDGSLRQGDQLLAHGDGAFARLRLQRERLRSSGHRVWELTADTLPVLGNVVNAVLRRSRRDRLILAGLVVFCLAASIVYGFRGRESGRV
jgi:hypothetical protein